MVAMNFTEDQEAIEEYVERCLDAMIAPESIAQTLLEIAMVFEVEKRVPDWEAVVEKLLNEAGRLVGIVRLEQLALSTQRTLAQFAKIDRDYYEECERDGWMRVIVARTHRQDHEGENEVIPAFGYSRWEMLCAFNKVRNILDWKGTINAEIQRADQDVVEAAIIFFTASTPTFTNIPHTSKCLVEAAGYYWAMGS